MALLFGGAAAAISQAPQVSGVDGKQYALIVYTLDSPRQSYEKICGPFYLSEVLGKGSELIGFRFIRNGETEHAVVSFKNLSVMVDEGIASPTAQEVSEEDGGHYILRMKGDDYLGKYHECLAGVVKMK